MSLCYKPQPETKEYFDAKMSELAKCEGIKLLIAQMLLLQESMFNKAKASKSDEFAKTAAEYIGFAKAVEKIKTIVFKEEDTKQ